MTQDDDTEGIHFPKEDTTFRGWLSVLAKKIFRERYYITAFVIEVALIVVAFFAAITIKNYLVEHVDSNFPTIIYSKMTSPSVFTIEFSFAPNLIEPAVFEIADNGTKFPVDIKAISNEPIEGAKVTDKTHPFLQSLKIKRKTKHIVKISLQKNVAIGGRYIMEAKARNFIGTTRAFFLRFTGYNSARVGAFIKEVQITNTKASKTTPPLCEYIRFHITKGGNLSGLRAYSVSDGVKKAYVFYPLKVAGGEDIVLHLRPEAGCCDEKGEDTSASTSAQSLFGVRDIWNFRNSGDTLANSRLNNSADVIVLEWDDGTMLDCLPYSNGKYGDWKNDEFVDTIKKAQRAGIWLGNSSIQDAVDSAKTNKKRPLVKVGDTKDKSAWQVFTPPKKKRAKSKGAISSAKKDGIATTSTSAKKDATFKYKISDRAGVDCTFQKISPIYSGAGGKFYSEYITLKFLKGGNIGGMLIFSIKLRGGMRRISLPACTIKDGEVVTVHLASKGDGCISELGDNLDLATALFCTDGQRDIWTTQADSALKADTDILDNNMGVVLVADKDGGVLDFVAYKTDGCQKDATDDMERALSFAIENNLWSGGFASFGKGNSSKHFLSCNSTLHNASSWVVK